MIQKKNVWMWVAFALLFIIILMAFTAKKTSSSGQVSFSWPFMGSNQAPKVPESTN